VEINAASDEAIQLLNGLSEEAPENMDYRLALARTWRNRALISHMRREPGQAEQALQTSIRELEELVQSHPESTTLMFELADALCMNLPVPPGRERNESAGSRIDQAIQICEQLMEIQPGNPEYQALSALALSRKAGTLRDVDQAATARDLWRQALPLQQSLVEQFPTVTQYRIACAQSLAGIAETESRLGNRAEAVNRFDEAIRLLENGSLDAGASDFLLRLAEQLRHMKQRFAAPGERPPGSPRPAPLPRRDASPEHP
jgi:tetratricopeptide (TPR) repeat protein